MYLPKELAAAIEDLCNILLHFYLWLDLSCSLGLWLMFRTEPLMSLNFAPSPWYTPWLIWLMIVFPVVPIRNFLAGKNWQADQGVFSFLSAPLLLIPHRHLLPASWNQLWIPSSRAFPPWPQWVCCCSVLPLSTETFWSCCLFLQGHSLPIFQGENSMKRSSWKRSPGFSLPSQDTAFNMDFLKPLSLSF